MSKINRTISVAPMMDCTDRHDRYFLRLISKNVLLYTEMVSTGAALNGDREKVLGFSNFEKPLALQVGGSNKNDLAEVAKIAEDMGYDEININLGCPSKKVQKNMFGACLMKEPDLVAECISSMVNSCRIPVTAKTRIGFDDTEEFDYLNNFIHKIRDAGTSTFILHARKAMLTGLSPKQNLNIPKLNYKMVYDIKKENPGMTNIQAFELFMTTKDYDLISSGEFHNQWFLELKDNNFIDKMTGKKINDETMRLLEIQKDSMVKFLMKIPKLYYTKSHFPLEISQRAFDHLWRVCESYEMWCKETKQEDLITLKILD